MSVYAEVQKLEEDRERVRYKYTDVEGGENTLLLNKVNETISLETGSEDILYRTVAGKIASLWLRDGVAPDHLFIQ
ncbi:hypothetical protein GZH49_40330 [Nocardia terpenica]|uniref:hypothetical protein n=1 Tax=Nocardia terpenica TaxID=455432 RepID=UPI002FE33C34